MMIPPRIPMLPLAQSAVKFGHENDPDIINDGDGARRRRKAGDRGFPPPMSPEQKKRLEERQSTPSSGEWFNPEEADWHGNSQDGWYQNYGYVDKDA